MGEEIIRSQAEIEGASTAVLVNTYNALTGKNIKKFENRAIAESKVTMEILKAKDAAGHLGVPKGQEPKVLTQEERDRLAADKGLAVGSSESASDEDSSPSSTETIVRPAKKVAEPKPKRARAKKELGKIQATNAGKSKPQADSVRGKVLATIQAAPNGLIEYSELEAKFGEAARGCVLKLLEKEHVKLVQ